MAASLHGRGVVNFDAEWHTTYFSLSACFLSFFFSSPSSICLVTHGHVRLRFGYRRTAKWEQDRGRVGGGGAAKKKVRGRHKD
jgi:hypothetical protein